MLQPAHARPEVTTPLDALSSRLTRSMEPAALPLEIFVAILEHLDPLCTWRLRTVSRSWNRALSSDLATSLVLGARDSSTFKRHYIGQPVRYIDYSSSLEIEVQDVACSDRHIVLRYSGDTHREGLSSVLLIQEIGGGLQRVPAKRRGLHSSRIVLGDLVAFLGDLDLVVCTLEGQAQILPVPNLAGNQTASRTNAINIFKDKVAFVCNQLPPVAGTPAIAQSDNLWTYDCSANVWTSTRVAELEMGFTLPWVQGLYVEENDLIVVSVVLPHVHENSRIEPLEHTVHFWSQSGSHWQQSYMVTPNCSDLQDPRGCNTTKLGCHYQIHVATHIGMHNILLTHDRIVSVDARPIVSRDGTGSSYRVVPFSLETRAGFLWHNLQPQRFEPSHLIVNDEVVLWMRKHVSGTDLFLLRFDGDGSLNPHFTWEEREADTAVQIERRKQMVSMTSTQHDAETHGYFLTPPPPRSARSLGFFSALRRQILNSLSPANTESPFNRE